MLTTSKSLWLCSLAIVCVFVGTIIPAEAGRRGSRSTTTDTPPPVVVDPNIPIVSAQ